MSLLLLLASTIVVPMTIEDMAVEASCVARARVVNTQATWDDAHRRIYTYTEVQILERLHTKGEVLDSVVIRTLGGEVGNIGMKVSGTPQFALGEEVVVFLRSDPVDATQFQVIGMSQGKFHVERPDKGGAVAVPSVEGLAFAKPGADGKMKIDPTNVDAARIPLNVMRDRVLAAVRAPVPQQQPGIDVTPPVTPPNTTIDQ
jgi:hypothetical protein